MAGSPMSDPGLGQVVQPLTPSPQPGMTLGQANPQGGAGGNDLLQQYLQALQVTQGIVRPGMLQLEPPTPGPGLLETLGTFGIANMVHHASEATRREENFVKDLHNRQLQVQAGNLALQVMNNQAKNQQTALMQQIAAANLGINAAKLGILGNNSELNALRAKVDIVQKGTLPPPKNEAEARMYDRLGLTPGQGIGGVRFGAGPRLSGSPETGWNVDPNSPMGQVLGRTGGGDVSGTPSGRQPGETLGQQSTREEAAASGAKKAAEQGAISKEEFDRNAGIVMEALNNPQWRDAMGLLPTSVGGAAAASIGGGRMKAWYARKFPGRAGPGAGYLQMMNTKVLPALRAMEGGAKNTRISGQIMGEMGVRQQMNDLVNLRMTPTEAETFRRNIRQDLDRIRSVITSPDAASTATTVTPTSSTTSTTNQPNARRLSSGAMIYEEP